MSTIKSITLPIPAPTNHVQDDVHVVPMHGKWAVKVEYLPIYTGTYSTQAQAIKEGREIAKGTYTSLVIHSADGRFRDVYSYSTYK